MRVFEAILLASALSLATEARSVLETRNLQDGELNFACGGDDQPECDDYDFTEAEIKQLRVAAADETGSAIECAGLKDFNKDDSGTPEGYVLCFSSPTDTHDVAEFKGGYQIGIITGFIVTGIAMIFAVYTIIDDEFQRHARFAQNVEDAK